MKCGFPEYGSSDQCHNDSVDTIEVNTDGKILKIPVCKFHADTWDIMFGHKGLAALIRDNKIKGEWIDA